jgi:hypothetical protein
VEFAGLLLALSIAGCADSEPARVEVESPGETPRPATGSAIDEPSSCSWCLAYEGARTGDHSGTYVIHLYDGRGESRQTRQIAFQEEGVLGLTLAFGEKPLAPGWTGTRDISGSSYPPRWRGFTLLLALASARRNQLSDDGG